MGYPKIYRKRYIPDEIVELKDDIIIHMDSKIIITKWEVLKPRNDFTHGVSCYFLEDGYKVSKFLDKNDKLVYYYCDIIQVVNDLENDSIIFIDLLADVVIYENGFVKVLDIGEIAFALKEKLITEEQGQEALVITDKLLNLIYNGEFNNLVKKLEINII